MKHRNIIICSFLGLLLLADFGFSYYQYSQSYIDGDFAKIVLGYKDYNKILHEPFGLAALRGETYPGTNRFTAHAFMSVYFKIVPKILNLFFTPLNSLYITIAFTKLLVHIALVFLLSYFASALRKFTWKSWLCGAVLITPFFHAGATYYQYMTIIDDSITYVMFYALPMVFLLIYLLPFFRYYRDGYISHSFWFVLGWAIYTFFLVMFGALTSPIILIFSFFILGFSVVTNFIKTNTEDIIYRLFISLKKIDPTILLLSLWGFLISIYSFYIGTKNSENDWTPKPLEERFHLLKQGVDEAFLNPDNGLYYLYLFTFLNLLLLFIFYRKKQYRYFKIFSFVLLFVCVYTLFLPLGGYRWYRPLIVKHDTLLPVLLVVLFILSSSVLLLFRHLKKYGKLLYILALVPLLVFYTSKDGKMKSNNECEKQTLLELAEIAKNTNETCVTLPRKCGVAYWGYNKNCEQVEASAEILVYYNIFPRKLLYKIEE